MKAIAGGGNGVGFRIMGITYQSLGFWEYWKTERVSNCATERYKILWRSYETWGSDLGSWGVYTQSCRRIKGLKFGFLQRE